MSREPQGRGMGVVIALCAAIGATTVVATMTTRPAGRANDENAEYGQRLITHTTQYLGPDVANAGMRFMSSRLACASCHISAGAEPGNLSLVAAMSRYPRISPRSGGKETIEDRINGCMTRSMNGRALPVDGPEMIAMVAWLRFLADRAAAMGADQRKAHDPPEFKTPNRAADPEAGERVFEKRCAACHGKEGTGLAASTKIIDGYLFPPLWGPKSFNDGAGLHRVLTAARFVKAKMPLGRADLNDDEAFDVAAFLNSKPRPHMANLERDYPDRSKKPVDTSYPPYADSFPAEQHLLGPFAPIEKYYKELQKVSR
jgi:thiosulfate dehydrogenase